MIFRGKLSLRAIRQKIANFGCQNVEVFVYGETDSTNTRARLFAEECRDAPPCALFIAESQTAGRGRRGRSFESAPGAGLYMSLLLPLPEGFSDSDTLTAYAAVKAAEAIEAHVGREIQIKWVNDLYYGGRKLAGILCESKFRPDGNGLLYAVIGIGINVLKTEFSANIKDIADSLEGAFSVRVPREDLAAEITAGLILDIKNSSSAEIMEKYKKRSFLMGTEVTVHTHDSSYPARVLDIDDSAALIVECASGEIRRLTSGEVSVRGK